jgi:hypothetical protein
MNNYLMLITEFNDNLKLRKLNINEVEDKMNQIEDMLKLNFTMGFYTRTLDKNKVFHIIDGKHKLNSCLFLYIDHYRHLTNNKKELSKIKEVGMKIMKKFINYLSNYNDRNIVV